jgi:large subunit ribosomal protein L4
MPDKDKKAEKATAEKPARTRTSKASPAAEGSDASTGKGKGRGKSQGTGGAKTKKAQDADATGPQAELRTVGVVNAKNEKVRDVSLSPDVFGGPVNDHLLYEAVKHYRAGGRAGTHATKNRANVSGSGRKPWKQKGTGRARVGETRTPLWRHGGTVFGPVPRSYESTMPKKARAAALRSALAMRANEGALKVVDGFAIEMPSKAPFRLSQQLKGLLAGLGLTGKMVLVDHQPTDALVLSGRNIPGVKVVDPSYLNVYDVLDCRTLVVTPEALNKLEERLTP